MFLLFARKIQVEPCAAVLFARALDPTSMLFHHRDDKRQAEPAGPVGTTSVCTGRLVDSQVEQVHVSVSARSWCAAAKFVRFGLGLRASRRS
jgi:hypothetical protein